MLNVLFVGVGGFVGSIARYLTYLLVRTYLPLSFPAGTLLVNSIGCLGIGFFSALMERHPGIPPQLALLVTVGIFGGFTTFSAFGLESVALWRAQQPNMALLNVGLNVFFGFGAVLLGRATAQL